MITAYCLWIDVHKHSAKNYGCRLSCRVPTWMQLLAQSGGIGDLLDPGFINKLVVYFYGGVIALSALFQGGTALYYFSRRRLVEEYIAETPEWVRDVQRTQSV